MNRKERIGKITKGEIPDYTPHHFDLTVRMTDRLVEWKLSVGVRRLSSAFMQCATC